MRAFQRTLTRVCIAPRECVTDALGGVREGFSDTTETTRGNVFPSTAGLRNAETGLVESRTIGVLLPARTEIRAGDGLCTGDEERPCWRCTEVHRWPHHVMVLAVRITGGQGT